MRKLCLFLAAAAGGALASVVSAQAVDTPVLIDRASMGRIVLDASTMEPSYESRAVIAVYDAEANAACLTTLGTNKILEDVSFVAGPWAATTNNVLREITFPLAPNGALPAGGNYDLRIRILETADITANPMVSASATPLFNAVVPVRGLTAPAYLTLTNLNAGAGVVIPGNSCFIELSVLGPGVTTPHPTVGGALIAANQNAMPVGSSTDGWGRDRNNDGNLVGGTLDAPLPNEHIRTLFAGGACVGQAAVIDFILEGDVGADPPVVFTDLGTITDAGLNRSDTYAAGEVKWFRFNLAGDVTDARRTFLDMDTEGSTLAPTNDPIIILYDNAGNIVALDNSSGSALQSQMSFGIGNRAANGDGLVFDGIDAELLAANGPFWLGVAGFPAATVDDGWVLTSESVETGNIAINVRTNSENAGPLAPSVEPNFTLVDSGNPILAPGIPVADENPGLPGVLWYKFVLCTNIDGSSPDNFLDVDFSRSDAIGTLDQEVFLFNAAGNLIAIDDDDGPAATPQLSFGHTGPRPPYSTVPGDPEFTGADGALPAGTYYLAVGFFDVRELSTAATDGRWFVRPLGGDDLDIATDIYTGATACSATCGSADFDGDGDTGTDADIEAFFACLGGNCCTTCESADFDGDGDTGTDADIEAFFRVLGGGTC